MPRIAINAVTVSASDQSGTGRADRLLQPRHARLRLAQRLHRLLEHDALLAMRQLLAHQPTHVRAAPCLLARVMAPQPQQKRAELLTFAAQIRRRRLARANQIAHRLVPLVGRPNARQLARPQQSGQAQRVAPIGLHPIAGLSRRHRRRHDHARVPEFLDQPVEAVARRSRLVAEQ
jgi:hypothetical protein